MKRELSRKIALNIFRWKINEQLEDKNKKGAFSDKKLKDIYANDNLITLILYKKLYSPISKT